MSCSSDSGFQNKRLKSMFKFPPSFFRSLLDTIDAIILFPIPYIKKKCNVTVLFFTDSCRRSTLDFVYVWTKISPVLLLSRDFPTSNVNRLVIGWRLLLPSHWLSPLVVLASDWCFPMLLLPPDWSLLISDACLLARDWWAAREEPVKVVADSPHVFAGLLGNASQRASCRRGRRSSRLLQEHKRAGCVQAGARVHEIGRTLSFVKILWLNSQIFCQS